MKTQIFNAVKLVFLLLVSILIFSCSKDNDESSAATTTNTFTCKVNGNQWTGINPIAGVELDIFALSAKAADRTEVSLAIASSDFVTGKTIPLNAIMLGGVNVQIQAGYTSAADVSFYPTSGSIVLTSVTNDRVVGTFSFKAKRNEGSTTVEVTDGVFNMPYQKL